MEDDDGLDVSCDRIISIFMCEDDNRDYLAVSGEELEKVLQKVQSMNPGQLFDGAKLRKLEEQHRVHT